MKQISLIILTGIILLLMVSACVTKQPPIVIDSGSAVPGTQVSRQGVALPLLGKGIAVGQPLPASELIDAATMESIDLNDYQGSVLFLNIVPSVDTKVCEAQTHLLGEEGDKMPPAIKRFTISRDTPFAQNRFAREAKLKDLQYLSDYKEGAWGRSTGLLVDNSRLLARAVVLVDKQGVVQYIQLVPDISHLPDMERAFQKAIELNTMP